MFKNGFMLLIVFSISMVSCEKRMDKEAMIIVRNMTIEEKIGQMLMIGIPGKETAKESATLIEDYLPGGIVLFGYNVGHPDEVKNLIRSMQKIAIDRYNIPLFISIDQEGGRVRRIIDRVTQFPGNMALGVVNNEKHTYNAARITGIQLRTLGVNMNLAPALDVNNNPSNPVINTRSFGSDAGIVASMGGAYMEGLQRSGCIAVGKHFPGHGDTDRDSHLTLPVIRYDINRLRKVEFIPFINAIDKGVEAVMTAHISYPNILKDNMPATLSGEFLSGILRDELRFKGLIITDDIEMSAVSKLMDIGEVAVRSIQAGADIVLISTHGKSISKISEAVTKAVREGIIPEGRINESVLKILEIKLRYNIINSKEDKIICPEYYPGEEESEILNKAEELNRIVSRAAVYFYSGNDIQGSGFDISNCRFISSSAYFRNRLKIGLDNFYAGNDTVFNSAKDFINYITVKKIKDGIGDTTVYYHFDQVNASVRSVIDTCGSSGIRLCLICTGNPFLLKDIKKLPPALITFSNTDESINQAVAWLNREFKAKTEVNVNLGFNK